MNHMSVVIIGVLPFWRYKKVSAGWQSTRRDCWGRCGRVWPCWTISCLWGAKMEVQGGLLSASRWLAFCGCVWLTWPRPQRERCRATLRPLRFHGGAVVNGLVHPTRFGAFGLEGKNRLCTLRVSGFLLTEAPLDRPAKILAFSLWGCDCSSPGVDGKLFEVQSPRLGWLTQPLCGSFSASSAWKERRRPHSSILSLPALSNQQEGESSTQKLRVKIFLEHQ